MPELMNILLTGGSGQLGKTIIQMNLFPSLFSPPKQELDITDPLKIEAFFNSFPIDAVIHCAALARMSECEKDPLKALQVNTVGTSNLISVILKKEKEINRKIRMIYLSTEGVYAGTKGNYSESDETLPYNIYGWTKLGAECSVRLLSNYCIIRTGFFDPQHILFDTSAIDMFSSRMPIQKLAKAVAKLLYHPFIGTINVGEDRKSDYERYKVFKSNLKPSCFEDIVKSLSFKIAKDASMNCEMWEQLNGV